MSMTYEELDAAGQVGPSGNTSAAQSRDELESYRLRLMALHAQQQERARAGYDLAGESQLIEGGRNASMAAEQGYAAGGVGGLRSTAYGTMDASQQGLASAQQDRLQAVGQGMDVEAARAGYEQSVASSELARKGMSMEAAERISAARRAATARMAEMRDRIIAGSVGAISGGMASGANYGATSGQGAEYGGEGAGMYGDGDQPGPYYGG